MRSTTPTSAVPPAARSFDATEEAQERNHPRGARTFPDMTGVIDPRAIAHHSGGPYLSQQAAAQIALRANDCTLTGGAIARPSHCTEVDVRFFNHYGDFWALEGGQTQFVGSWGADREMYVVTVFGDLSFPTTDAAVLGDVHAPDRTYQLDATTGQIQMTGGPPLPTSYSDVYVFR
jgi:hypothetical protein